jgi:fluoroacetyl-CoA thioesterase
VRTDLVNETSLQKRMERETAAYMKSSLMPGACAVSRIVVDKAKTVGFMGEEGRVYATPHLIADIETTCRNLITAHADANEDSVGMEVVIKHLAPAPTDVTVEITVEVIAVEGRKVTFAFTAKDELDMIGTGSHGRFVADKTKIIERLKGTSKNGGFRRFVRV